jgi:1,4-alpha-glucan branching enzyme
MVGFLLCSVRTPQLLCPRQLYTESHDEVANGKARVPEEIDPGHAESWAARKRSTLGAAIVFTAPGIPMLFQGQEFLEDDWFHDQDPLDWSKKERYAGIFRLYKDLIALRRNKAGHTRGLCGQEVSVHHVNNNDKVIAFHRWDQGGPADSVVVIANFSAHRKQEYLIGFPAEGKWAVRFNSDSRFYDGEFSDTGSAEVIATADERDGLSSVGTIDIAPYSAIILSQE